MYCRYTEFSYDPDQSEAIRRFWQQSGGPAAAHQGGFQGALVIESVEADGVMRAISLWKNAADFEEFYAGAEHQQVIEDIKSLSMTVGGRDGLNVVTVVEPVAALTRMVRCKLRDGAADEFREFWQTRGKALAETDRGCIKAEAYVDANASEAVLCFHWRTLDEAAEFLKSDLHENVLAPGLEQFLTPIARLHAQSL